MQIIETKLKELWATDIVWKGKKETTEVKYKLNGKSKKLVFENWEVAIKVFKVKEKYQPIFIEHQKRVDELTLKLDEEFKPTIEEFKKEVQEATENELLKQLESQLN